MENSWLDLFPQWAPGEDWQQSLNDYTQKLWDQAEEFFSGTLKNSQDIVQLWQVYIEEMQKFNSQLWVNISGDSIDSLSVGSFWIKLNDLYWNLAYEKTLGSLTHIPVLGPNRTFNIQSMRAVDAWVKLYPATVNYQIVLMEIQMQSFLELMRELNSLAARGEPLQDWPQLQQLWSVIADKVFERAFLSENNLKVRGKFLNAVNHYKLCQQELMELWMQVMNIPIRSEIDEVHKSIYELRKEVKSLKKTLVQSYGSDHVHEF